MSMQLVLDASATRSGQADANEKRAVKTLKENPSEKPAHTS
jgi:hypothetical protein